MSETTGMADRIEIARAYFGAFARNDHPAILALLTDDVIWDIYGHRHLQGREAFDSEIENDEFEGSPDLTIHRMIVGVDTVVVPHRGAIRRRADGALFEFEACDALTFEGDLISRVESWVVPT